MFCNLGKTSNKSGHSPKSTQSIVGPSSSSPTTTTSSTNSQATSSNSTTPIRQHRPSNRRQPTNWPTSHSRFKPIHSIVRRFCNLMEYCVNALNEASSTSCSNRFDLLTHDQPIWLLGRLYDLPKEANQLIDDIRSKLWVTYRRNFPPIDSFTRYTTDKGFGCMIRCGQMVLANALINKNLGRDWRWSGEGLDSNPKVYSSILKLFQDKDDSHYSIHNIVKIGTHEGKTVGEWFGPNTIAQALKRLSKSFSDKVAHAGDGNGELLISIDAALDNVVVIDEVKSRFYSKKSQPSTDDPSERKKQDSKQDSSDQKVPAPTQQETSQTITHQWIPGVLFIQLRLGLTKINPLYFDALKKTFQLQSSLGIIGGRPNHALYFIGTTEDDIIYLDPHITQQYIDLDSSAQANLTNSWAAGISTTDSSSVGNISSQASSFWSTSILSSGSGGSKTHEDHSKGGQSLGQQQHQGTTNEATDSTYHCSNPEKMPLDRLDPSLALCFYFQTEQDFDTWCTQSNDLLIKSEKAPMFEITKVRPATWAESIDEKTDYDQTCEWNVIEM